MQIQMVEPVMSFIATKVACKETCPFIRVEAQREASKLSFPCRRPRRATWTNGAEDCGLSKRTSCTKRVM